jgi:ech hydrogenase subunit C
VFRECYNTFGGVDAAIPVDVYVPGCATRPEAIIDGVVTALGILDQKTTAARKAGGGAPAGVASGSQGEEGQPSS